MEIDWQNCFFVVTCIQSAEKKKSVVEKKIIELEFFTKKKFDELVNEIKNFIPIHFNSYIRDYKIIESPVKKRNFRQISFEKNEYSHF